MKSGDQIFTQGTGFFSWIINKVEGRECSHQAGVFFDQIDCCDKVAEMIPHIGYQTDLVITPLKAWVDENRKRIVAIARPKGISLAKRAIINEQLGLLSRRRVAYDGVGLLGFILQKIGYRKPLKVNVKSWYFCSEFWLTVLLKAGISLSPLHPGLASPQDIYKQIGTTLKRIE